ncbi:hypothetical protein J7T55_015465 [Diaporthe amygdali]|uniref:uncharacterized protein n=1 Tax=Phomopsis amygdali TaxID=1214568 RepID=UPI0022FE6B36|nr:uncharacterized protein J7T55_015465 [Diaporthe amygdali]KAJ0120733.1 hypothetical protein J7T55_015465 [Diaporthe amygdali]
MEAEPNQQTEVAISPALERKLVTLRKITQIRRPLKLRVKRIEVVTITGGWNVVVNKSNSKVGDYVIFFEIDSFIPTTVIDFGWELNGHLEEFNGERGYHVRSHMVGKQISQGWLMTIEQLPKVQRIIEGLKDEYGVEEGLRVAQLMAFEDVLGVKKWESSTVSNHAQDHILGPAPVFIRQPGCPRIQDKPQIFTSIYPNCTYEITEKLDGVSMTVYRVQNDSQWDRALPALPADSSQRTLYGRIGIASRQHDIGDTANSPFWRAAKDIGLPAKLAQVGIRNVAISGELIGPSLDSSIHFAPGERFQFIVFQVFDIDAQELIDPDEVRNICNRHVLPHVPLIARCKLSEFATDIDELVRRADGVGFHGQRREGLVFKLLGRPEISFKVISNQWLLELEE